MEVTHISIWGNYPYQDGAMTVWKPGASIPAPIYSKDVQVHIPKGRAFNEVRIPASYAQLMTANYIELDCSINGVSKIFYGWVDGVELLADGDEDVVSITWRQDLWRMYIQSAVIGKGIVLRRPFTASEQLPPQPYPYRWKESVNIVDTIIPNNTTPASLMWWGFVVLNLRGKQTVVTPNPTEGGTTQEEIEVSSLETFCFPIFKAGGSTSLSGGGPTLTLSDIRQGRWDELLKVAPADVKGAWISPYAPNDAVASQSSCSLSGWTPVKPLPDSTRYLFRANSANPYKENTWTSALVGGYKSDDVNTYFITGFDREVIGSLPWGINIDSLKVRCIVGDTSAYVQIRTGNQGHCDGTCWTIPMVPLGLTDNGVSAYAYSGARESDLEQMKFDAHQERWNRVEGQAMIRGPEGSTSGEIGQAIHAMNPLAMKERYNARADYDRALQVADQQVEINTHKAATQTNGLIMSSPGLDCMFFGTQANIVEMKIDDYSKTQREQDMEMYGAHVREPTASCQSLVTRGGPLQIANCEVTGDIPPQARDYIKGRLNMGVIIE